MLFSYCEHSAPDYLTVCLSSNSHDNFVVINSSNKKNTHDKFSVVIKD